MILYVTNLFSNNSLQTEDNATLSPEKHNPVNWFSCVWSRAQSILALGKTTQSPACLVINVHIYQMKKKVLERLMLPISLESSIKQTSAATAFGCMASSGIAILRDIALKLNFPAHLLLTQLSLGSDCWVYC